MIMVPVDQETRGKDIKVEIKPKRMSLVKSGVTLLEGSLAEGVVADNSFWSIETSSNGSKTVQITLAKKEMGYGSWSDLLESERVDPVVTDRAFLEIKIGEEIVGKMCIGLFGDICPKTVANFKALCTGENGLGKSGLPLHYKGCQFHRIIEGFMAQGGDITLGNGMGGESIFGPQFDDENFKIRHDSRGLLCMANAGPNTNSSQFYITFRPTPHLDGKHVVFGKIEVGLDLLNRIEAVGTESGEPNLPVSISDSGSASFKDIEIILDENKRISMSKLSY